MNKTTKYVGLLALLPLLTASFLASPIGDAEAVGGLGVKEQEERSKGPQAAPEPKLSLIQIGEPQKASPPVKSYKGFNEAQYDNTPTFTAVYRVYNAADSDVRNVEILVNSDVQTVQAELQGNLDPKHSVISVMIKADDPSSINARIVSFEAF